MTRAPWAPVAAGPGAAVGDRAQAATPATDHRGRVNGYASATRAYTESSVLTAPPERLVVMLYDGAARFLARAAATIRAGQPGAAGEPLGRAQAILHELLATLDPSAGEIAERLQSIYLFCERTLVEAQLERDADKVDSVAELLAELRDAWAQIADQGQGQPSSLGELSA